MECLVCAAAPAKINLFLHVVRRRKDGYHELASLVVFADVADSIELTWRGPHRAASTLRVIGPFASSLVEGNVEGPWPPENSVVRAVEAWRRWCGPAQGAQDQAVDIVLNKHLPVAAGIGGGTADAAATVRLLRQNRQSPASDLSSDPSFAQMLLSLGADVPVSYFGQAAYVTGIGEQITPADGLPPLPAVLVNPGISVATPSVFRAIDIHTCSANPLPGFVENSAAGMSFQELISYLSKFGNDLQPAAITMAPVIGTVLQRLADSPHCALQRMSGSGATCFGLYRTPADAAVAAAAIQKSEPDWWVRATTLNSSADLDNSRG